MDKHNIGWEDAKTRITAGTDDAFDASWYLVRNRVWPLVRFSGAGGPIMLGAILGLLIVLIVLLSPSAESHFIYTDF